MDLLVGLNKGQSEAFNLLTEFIDDRYDDSMFVLRGFAGTGKTYLVNRIIRYVRSKHPNYKIALTAPTNKAVKVIKRAGQIKPDSKIEFQTVHKLLGLTEEITKDGEQIFTRKERSRNLITNYKVLVIDEVSMLDDSLFEEIEPYRESIKLIFMGDPAQIPPVNRRTASRSGTPRRRSTSSKSSSLVRSCGRDWTIPS